MADPLLHAVENSALELGQPLCAIGLYASAAQRWLDKGPESIGPARDAVAGILVAMRRAQQLIDAMQRTIEDRDPDSVRGPWDETDPADRRFTASMT